MCGPSDYGYDNDLPIFTDKFFYRMKKNDVNDIFNIGKALKREQNNEDQFDFLEALFVNSRFQETMVIFMLCSTFTMNT